MTGVDYLQFRQTYRNSLIHSPKGTTWKNHKYIKKDGDRYIYPTSPEAERLRKKNYMKDKASFAFGSLKKEVRGIKYAGLEAIDKTLEDIGKMIDRMKYKTLEEAVVDSTKYSKDKALIYEYRDKNGAYKAAPELDKFRIVDGKLYEEDSTGRFRRVY